MNIGEEWKYVVKVHMLDEDGKPINKFPKSGSESFLKKASKYKFARIKIQWEDSDLPFDEAYKLFKQSLIEGNYKLTSPEMDVEIGGEKGRGFDYILFVEGMGDIKIDGSAAMVYHGKRGYVFQLMNVGGLEDAKASYERVIKNVRFNDSCTGLCGGEIVGAEKLKIFESKIPETLARNNISFGTKVKYRMSMTFLPSENEHPQKKEFYNRSSWSKDVTKEIIKVNAKEITVVTVTEGGKRIVGTEPRLSITSTDYWVLAIEQGYEGGRVLKMEFLEAKYLGKMRIKGIDSHGMHLSMSIVATSPATGKSFSATVFTDMWVTDKLPRDGIIKMSTVYSFPEDNLKAKQTLEYLGMEK